MCAVFSKETQTHTRILTRMQRGLGDRISAIPYKFTDVKGFFVFFFVIQGRATIDTNQANNCKLVNTHTHLGETHSLCAGKELL